MKEWAKLSNKERAQARLNFADAKQLPADERKAKWEAYQALSDEEKSRLAARAPAGSPGATAAIRPVPVRKLAPVPTVGPDPQHTPRIQLAPPAAPQTVARPVAPPTSSAPVSAEAQVPAPAATPAVEPPVASTPAVRLNEQPAPAP